MKVNKRVMWIILVAVLVVLGSYVVMRELHGGSDNAALVDSKISLLAERYQGLNNDDIIQREGGYNEELGLYGYRYVWNYGAEEPAILKYEGVADLSRETLDQVYAVHVDEEDQGRPSN